MVYPDFIKKQMEQHEKSRKQLLKDVENIKAMQIKLMSPTYALLNGSELNDTRDGVLDLQSKLNAINSSSSDVYNKYINDREKVHKQVKEMAEKLNIPQQSIQTISESLKPINTPTPLELVVSMDIPKLQLEKIDKEFYETDWNEIKEESTVNSHTNDLYTTNFVNENPEEFMLNLYGFIEEINDNELTSIFTQDFLKEVTRSWWIIPRLKLDDYKKLSQRGVNNNDLNQLILSEYYTNPELIYTLINSWNISNERRLNIIIQAFDNYCEGNYEICVLTLLLQIEGLMRDKLQLKLTGGKLRNKLEKKLDVYLEENSSDYTPWGLFLIKSFKSYLWCVLNPLDNKVNLVEDTEEINRNISAHVGFVKADQKIAIRLFMIIDTLMFLLDLI